MRDLSGVREALVRRKDRRTRRLLPLRTLAFALLAWVAIHAPAQTPDPQLPAQHLPYQHLLDRFDVQVHGYATQGFLYTTQNNIYTTRSSEGSWKWSDAILNIGAELTPSVRVGAQGRYFRFGKYSDGVSIDWAEVDYRANEHFGVRVGKVKTPSGLYNEVQDIDPAYIWSLLPPSIYPVSSRNSILAHVGGVVYGDFRAGPHLGKLQYRGWGGREMIGRDDGFLTAFKELGYSLPDGLNGGNFGAALIWKTPLPGLTAGATDTYKNMWDAKLVIGDQITGKERIYAYHEPDYFASYEHGRFTASTEYSRFKPVITSIFPGAPQA